MCSGGHATAAPAVRLDRHASQPGRTCCVALITRLRTYVAPLGIMAEKVHMLWSAVRSAAALAPIMFAAAGFILEAAPVSAP